jgi:hypothetical protein
MTNGLAYLAALTLAALFLYSAMAKLRTPQVIRRVLDVVKLPSRVVAPVVPVAELITAFLLVVRPSIGSVVAIALLSIFTLFIAYLLIRRIDVSCGCFGAKSEESVSAIDLVRNGFLLGLAVISTSVTKPSGVALQEVIAATTTVAICCVLLAALKIRNELGQLLSNRLPGEQ